MPDTKTRAKSPTLPETLRLKIAYRKVADLKPYAGNARTHSDKQIDQIAASIRQFGFVNPVLIDGDDGIVAGHGRVAAARKLGIDEVPVIELAHLSDAERRAYVIADNRLAELAGWDQEILAIELQALSDMELDFDLEITGFETAEIDLLLEDGDASDRDPDDAVPEPVDGPAITRPGDIWQLGRHRLICGDALDAATYTGLMVDALVRVMLDAKVGVLVLDPLGAIHNLPENDNNSANTLMGALRQIADRTGAAIVLVHHVGKAAGADMGAAGASAARGASAIVDGARVVRQLVRMTDKEARQFGITDDERHQYVRVENGKANLAPAAKARWRRLVSVKLHNGTPEYPAGDTVAVVEDWTPPGPTVGTPSDLHLVQAAIQSAASKPRADKRSPSWAGYLIADTLSMDVGTRGIKAADRNPDQARAYSAVSDMLESWIADGGLRVVSEHDPRAGRAVNCVAAGEPAAVRNEVEGSAQ